MGVVVVALVVLLAALSPTLLFSQPLSAFDLVLTGASLIGIGLLVRWRGGAGARTLAGIMVIIGGVIVALGVGLTALLLAGWGRGY